MKDYKKPEAELITLIVEESITDDIVDGDTSVESLPPGLDW